MHTFLVSDPLTADSQARITGPDAKHIARVLRLSPGDRVKLTNGIGESVLAEIKKISLEEIQLEITSDPLPSTESPVSITIAQGMLKDAKMDMLIRHLTELGISSWIPFYAERSVPKANLKRLDNRIERWERISMEALKQCGRSRVPQIEVAMTFDKVIESSRNHDLKLAFWENATTSLASVSKTPIKPNGSVFILIGPEGGFPETEMLKAKEKGFIICSLGPRILRAETASLSAATLVQHFFGDLG